MTPLLSWFRAGCPFNTYACSSNTLEAIERMRSQGFVPMEQRIAQLIGDYEKADRSSSGAVVNSVRR